MPSLIGNKPNQVPTNGDLGTLAFQDATSVVAGKVVTTSDATINTLTVGLGGGAVSSNTAVGGSALNANTTGANNVAVGLQALLANTTGVTNIALGNSTLTQNTTGTYSTAIGHGALFQSGTAPSQSTAVGGLALAFCSGQNNVAVGFSAGGASGSTGGSNVLIGMSSGAAVTSGTQNTLLGRNAGFSGTNNLTTGSNNTIIGYNAAASSATVSNEITLGNASVTSLRVPALTLTAGAKWINVGTSTVAALVAAATAGNGARAFVTDALTPTFGSAVIGGGAVSVPVYSNGTTWNVG
jgi:hypothetical protein